MKKLFSLALAAAMALSMLTGCGGNSNNTNNDTNSADTQGSQTSQTQQLSGVVNTNGSTSMEKVMQVLIEAFKEQQPNVTVNYTGSGSGAAASSVRMASIMRSTSLSSCSGLWNISCAVGTLRRCSASYCSSAAHSSAGVA